MKPITSKLFVIIILATPALALADSASNSWDLDPIFGSASNKQVVANSKLGETSTGEDLVNAYSIQSKDPFWLGLSNFMKGKDDLNLKPHLEIETLFNNYRRSGTLDNAALNKVLSTQNTDAEVAVCKNIESLEGEKLTPALGAVHYGHCGSENSKPLSQKFKSAPITDTHKIRRAAKFFGDVRFKEAAAVLDSIDRKKLPLKQFCETQFLTGRTLFRIKPRRKESEAAYKSVVERCTKDAFPNLKKRALYSWGKRRFDLRDYAKSKTLFTQLLREFGTTSHADDALLYLARIAAKQGDSKSQNKWVKKALSEYPNGDMIHEIAWEFCEPLYRQNKFASFAKRLAALSLPDHDGNYLSQGRLLYFHGQALIKTSKKEKGISLLQRAWQKYPFSFYGYLSHLRLKKMNVKSELPARNKNIPDFLTTPKWTNSLVFFSHQNDMPQLRAFLAQSIETTDPASYWQKAYLYDKMGNYPQSHNIIRRKIKGRPWTEPESGRDSRVNLAWPTPFRAKIDDAIEKESKQHKTGTLHPAFPSSIMREESSFIVDVESWAGALGLMQLMPRTALAHDNDIDGDATVERLKTADVNIRVGIDHLMWLSRKTKGHPAMMAAGYNAGLGAVNRWLASQPNEDIALWVEDIPYFETRNYTKRVVGSYAAYQWVYGEKTLDTKLANPATP